MISPDQVIDPLPGQPTAAASTPVEFIKLSPTGNTTLLVRSRHAPECFQAIAGQMMSLEHVHAEQVGFALDPTRELAHGNLQMAGGEFCANACMSLAVVLADDLPATGRLTLTGSAPASITLQTTGTSALIDCRVHRGLHRSTCELTLPAHESIESFSWADLDRHCLLIRYRDAVHVVAECDAHDRTTRRRAEDLAVQVACTHGVALAGVMLVDRWRGEVAPLIYLPRLDSLVWERSCGSGTGSVGIYLTTQTAAPISAMLRQPGGTLRVSTTLSPDGDVRAAIAGSVQIVAAGTAWVDV